MFFRAQVGHIGPGGRSTRTETPPLKRNAKSPKFSRTLLRQLAGEERRLPDAALHAARGGALSLDRAAVWPVDVGAWPIDAVNLPTTGF